MPNRISIAIPAAAIAATALVSSPVNADTLTQALGAAVRSVNDANGPDTHLFPLDFPQNPPDAAQNPTSKIQNPDAPPPGAIRLIKFKRLRWSPGTNAIHTDGSVEALYTHIKDKSVTKLFTSDLDYNTETGILKATGSTLLERPEGDFSGETIEFNLEEDTGFVTNAIVSNAYFIMRGEKIEAKPKQTYVVTNGSFTTCEHERPDYRIRAKRLTVVGNKYVSARNITLYLGPTRLISLPSYRRNIAQSASAVATPRPAYSRSEGLTVRYADQLIADSNRTLDFDGRFGFKYPFVGFMAYRQDLSHTPQGRLPPLNRALDLTNPLHGILEELSPPTFEEYTQGRYPVELGPRITFFGAIQSRQFVFNRNRYDLLLSRYPEIGLSFANLLGHNPPDEAKADTASDNLLNNLTSNQSVLNRVPNAPFLLDAALSAGQIYENPTLASGFRFASRINVASQPLLIGRRLSLRAAASNWFNIYGTGSVYNLFSPEVDLNFLPTRSSLLGVGYRYETDAGKTPFFFDRRDLRHELRLRYQVSGPWAFGIQTSYDLERFASYETQIALLRNFDCLQFGVAYRFRSQQFNLIFNLLPPTPNRNRARREPIPNITP